MLHSAVSPGTSTNPANPGNLHLNSNTRFCSLCHPTPSNTLPELVKSRDQKGQKQRRKAEDINRMEARREKMVISTYGLFCDSWCSSGLFLPCC